MTQTEEIENLNDLLTRYKRTYRVGGRNISYKTLAKHMQPFVSNLDPSLDPTMKKDGMAFLTAQNKLNRLLRKRGMKLRSKNYGKTYYVVGDSRESRRMSKTIKRLTAARKDYNQGRSLYKATWSPLMQAETKTVAKYIRASNFAK